MTSERAEEGDDGYIVTTSSLVARDRVEIHLHVRLANGEAALIIDDRFTPYLFVRASDQDVLLAARVLARPTRLQTLSREPVVRCERPTPDTLAQLAARLKRDGVECFEADLRPHARYLIDRGLRGALRVSGPFQQGHHGERVYRNPTLQQARHRPTLRVLSLDIETDAQAGKLYSIAVTGAGGERVFLVRAEGQRLEALPPYAHSFADERGALLAFLEHVQRADPDALTGWNLPDFDLPVLARLCRRAGLRLTLGRSSREAVIRKSSSLWFQSRAELDGRVVLDGLALMRGSYIKLDDYSLETAARALLGRGKRFSGDARTHQIDHAYLRAPAELCAYNLDDAQLVLEILERTGLVELSVRRSLLTGLRADRVSGQIAAIDTLYLRELRRRGHVAPSVRQREERAEVLGGLTLPGRAGLYRNIAVYDFKSLYPSLIRTFNIDPLTYLGQRDGASRAPLPEGAITSPSGAMFDGRSLGVLPSLVERLLLQRAQATETGDKHGSQAIKILMNSIYGVLGTDASRLFSPVLANAIALAGQHVISCSADAAASLGYRVLYGDTDSLFVELGEPDEERATTLAGELREQISARVAEALQRDFGCESKLDLELEKVYARFFLPELRANARVASDDGDVGEGSKKRYAGLWRRPSGEQLEVVGLEAARRDASPVARRFQRELLQLVFHDEPVEPFARAFVRALRAGSLDAELTYRKAMRKPVESYTRTTPPHVKAARKLGDRAGRIITYVVTKAGPEPVTMTTAPLDYEHYVVHQLVPIARSLLGTWPDRGEAVLDALLGRATQLKLPLQER